MTFNHNGKTITLIQDAYADGGIDHTYYTAAAEDADGNQYQVNWTITHPDFESLEDESEACDWDNPSSIELI